MPAEIILQPSPEQLALLQKRAELTAIRNRLAKQEAELAQWKAQLKTFESRYFQRVGVLYAELDEIEARILERELHLYDSDTARRRAAEARERAQESHEAAFGTTDDEAVFDPPPDLKALFRELVKRIHPDRARDKAEEQYLHRLMARANQAYGRGDADLLQRLLDDYRELDTAGTGESTAAESLRLTRQIQQGERDLAQLDLEQQLLFESDIAQLHAAAEAAAQEHRDLLTELATGLREQLAAAQSRFEAVDRQVQAHGR